MAESSMPSWSDVPLELAGLILGRLTAYVDRVRFAAVCPRWRVAAREVPLPPSMPLLALPDGTVYSLPRSEPFHIPACAGYNDSCGNWLVFSREDGCFLRNPLSNETVILPALSRVQVRYVGNKLGFTWAERKHAKKLTVRRVKVCLPHLVAACVSFRGNSRIAVCQPGAFSWWSMHMDDQHLLFRDIIFHQGKLYVLDHCTGDLSSVDINIDHNTGDPWVSQVRRVINSSSRQMSSIAHGYALFKWRFLVELHGRMLMVQRAMSHRWKSPASSEMVPRTWRNKFKVFEADFELSKWSKVTSIGDDQVLFLQERCSRFVCVSQYKIPGDSIFFLGYGAEDGMGSGGVDDNQYPEEGFGPCRVFDMGDGKVSDSLPTLSWNSHTALATWLFPQGQE